MTLKILGGIAKGRVLLVPKRALMRATSVRLRRSLFDHQQDWSGKTVVDLCAGTGAVGLEAWSRGADKVYLVESSGKVIPFLKKNIAGLREKFPEEEKRRPLLLECQKLPQYFYRFKQTYQSWDHSQQLNTVLFFDPPYNQHLLYRKVLEQIFVGGWFKGNLYLESDKQKGVQLDAMPAISLPPSKTFLQGGHYLALFLF